MATTEAWYISERSEALAIVHLTRRDDFTVVKAPSPDSSLDLIVTIGSKGQPSGRIFGVVLKSLLTKDLPSDSNGTLLLPEVITQQGFLAEIPFPVCCLCFVVDTDYGYYRWLVQPTVDESERANLSVVTDHEFKKLTNGELEVIATAVNRWYDARLDKLIA